MGKQLAIEHPVEADLVVPVPDSGVAAAIGYARESGINYRQAIIRNHYVGRTFIEPSQSIRSFGVRLKLNPIKDLINGRRVILVDDSIVRGTTSKKIVEMVRDAGATEVHMRISCPPTAHSCYYGVDTPHRQDLIASQNVGRRGPPVHRCRQPRLSLARRNARQRSASTPAPPAPPAGAANTRPSSPPVPRLSSCRLSVVSRSKIPNLKSTCPVCPGLSQACPKPSWDTQPTDKTKVTAFRRLNFAVFKTKTFRRISASFSTTVKDQNAAITT